MKKHTVQQALLTFGIATYLFPTYAQSQSTGNGSFSNPSGSSSTASPNQPGSSTTTRDSRSNIDTSSSTTRRTSPTNETQPQLDTNARNTNMTRDIALTESDGNLNNRIRTALNADSSLRDATQEVSLQSDNGMVTLNGTVATEKEKADLEFKVQHMAGVSRVQNNLQIAPRINNGARNMANGS